MTPKTIAHNSPHVIESLKKGAPARTCTLLVNCPDCVDPKTGRNLRMHRVGGIRLFFCGGCKALWRVE